MATATAARRDGKEEQRRKESQTRLSPGSKDARTRSATQAAPLLPPLRLLPARAGDHHAIQRLLASTLHRPSWSSFQACLEDPCYEPGDRLLIKHGPQIVAHCQLANRELRFGPLNVPVTTLVDLVVAPEYRSNGCGTTLLDMAERKMREDGARWGLLRTTSPQFFQERGWSVCLRHSYSVAAARDILSYLGATEPRPADPLLPLPQPPNVRIFRHVEQDALIRLYELNARERFGPLLRNEAYWRWLIGRRAFDRIYVAVDGPDRVELTEAPKSIVGYAVMRDGRILELMAQGDHEDAVRQLLARACRDAIEQDLHHVRLEAPPDAAWHRILTAAGGVQRFHEAENGQVSMVKLFAPWQWLESLSTLLVQRAKQAEQPLPVELGFQCGGGKYSLRVGPRGARVQSGRLGRSYLTLETPQLTQLLLGHLDVASAARQQRLRASTRVALESATALFPALPLWRPPWDELPGS